MNTNKSPGSEGLTAGFYKIFWNDIQVYLVKSLKYSYAKRTYRTSQTKYNYVTTKERYDINNQLEYDVLNVDYKIASQAIANKKNLNANHN